MMRRAGKRSLSAPSTGVRNAVSSRNSDAGRVTCASFQPNSRVSSGYSNGSVFSRMPFVAV